MRLPIVVLLVVCVGVAIADQPLSYNIEWAEAGPAQQRNLESTELGRCMCDLTQDACDPNCCCDRDCSIGEVFPVCKRSSHSTGISEKCSELDRATEIRRSQKSSSFSQPPTENEVPQLDRVRPGATAVCVVSDNLPSGVKSYFSNLPIGGAGFTTPSTREWKTRIGKLEVGNPIRGYVTGTDGALLREVNRGYISLPNPGRNGICNDDSSVRFLDPYRRSTCYREAPTPAALCSQLDPQQYLRIALSDDYVGMYVTVYSLETGARLREYTPPAQAPQGATTQEHNFKAEQATVCSEGVVRTELKITYSRSSTWQITNASMAVYVAPITSLRVRQEHVVGFVAEGKTEFGIPRSGSPGYVAGSKVRVGTLVTEGENSAIQERVPGLTVPSGKYCSANEFRSVEFLHDVKNSGCAVSVTQQEFSDLCTGGTKARLQQILAPTLGVSSLFNTTVIPINKVAVTGDAHIFDTNANAWTDLSGSDTIFTGEGAGSGGTYRCEDVTVGLHYVINLGRAGAEYNPQDLIFGARVEEIKGDWVFRNATGGSTTDLFFKFKVSFVRHTTEGTAARKVIPPPILVVDDDVFYPFQTPERRSDSGN